MRYDLIGDEIFNFRTVYKDGKWGLVSASNLNQEIVAPEWDETPWEEQSFIILQSKAGKYGLLYADATECLPIIYDSIKIELGHDGPRIIVSRLDGRCAILDKSGKELIPFTAKYSSLKYVSDEIIIAYKKELCGIITIKQEEVLPLEYTRLQKFSDDRWYVFKDDKCGLIDIDTKDYIIPCEFKEVDSTGEFFRAKNNEGKVKLYAFCGDEIDLGFELDAIISMDSNKFKVRKGKLHGIIKIEYKDGKYQFEPVTELKYSSISAYRDGFAIVANAQDCEGFIDETGKHIGPMNFESVRPFENGFAAVESRRSNKSVWGFMDTTGEIVIPYVYDKVSDFNTFHYASACKAGKWTVINTQGEEIIPCIYDNIGKIEAYPDRIYIEVTLDGHDGFVEVNTGASQN